MGGWSLFAATYDPTGLLFPGPWSTFCTLFAEAPRWAPSAWKSYVAMIISLGLSLILALPLVFVMLISRGVQALVQACFVSLQCLPLFVLAPILVMCLGWSPATILIPSVLMVLYPITMALWKGASAVPEDYVFLFKSCSASAWRTFLFLRVPFAAPQLFSGLRVGATTAGLAVVACEFAVGQSGLGMLIQESRRNFDLSMAFCSILLLGVEIASLYLLVVFLEWLLHPWRRHALMV